MGSAADPTTFHIVKCKFHIVKSKVLAIIVAREYIITVVDDHTAPRGQGQEMEMTIERARELAGAKFDDLADDVVLGALNAAENVMKRQFTKAEAHFFHTILKAKRAKIAQAGQPESIFQPEVYGDCRTAYERSFDNNDRNEG